MSGRGRTGAKGSDRASRQLGLFDPPCPSAAAKPDAAVSKSIVTADHSPRFHRPWLDKPRFEQRLILLLDMDAFFASAEQVARPELKGKPVIVGGLASDRSVVASASYEARALGVKTAMPIAQAHHICPQGVFLRGNYALYASLSKKVIEICKTFTPLVEQASIDEAYLDLAGTERLYSHSHAAVDARRSTSVVPPDPRIPEPGPRSCPPSAMAASSAAIQSVDARGEPPHLRVPPPSCRSVPASPRLRVAASVHFAPPPIPRSCCSYCDAGDAKSVVDRPAYR